MSRVTDLLANLSEEEKAELLKELSKKPPKKAAASTTTAEKPRGCKGRMDAGLIEGILNKR